MDFDYHCSDLAGITSAIVEPLECRLSTLVPIHLGSIKRGVRMGWIGLESKSRTRWAANRIKFLFTSDRTNAHSWRSVGTYCVVALGGLMVLVLTYYFHSLRTPLYDYSYIVTVPYRISTGQLPYRDFALPMLPGTFYVLAFFHSLFGWGSQTILLLTLISSLGAFFVVLDIARLINERFSFRKGLNWINFTFLVSAVLAGLNYILSLPFYDNLAILMVLISLSLLLRAQRGHARFAFWVLSGICILLPSLFKQNIGVSYVLGLGIVYILSLFARKVTLKEQRVAVSGVIVGLLIFVFTIVLALQIFGMLQPFFFQVVVGASSAKEIMSFEQLDPYLSIFSLLVVISAVLSAIVSSKKLSFGLLTWPWIFFGCSSILSIIQIVTVQPTGYMPTYAKPLELLPTLVISMTATAIVSSFRCRKLNGPFVGLTATVACVTAGAMLSQGAWGSSYALSPILLIGGALYVGATISVRARFIPAMLAISTFAFSLWVIAYAQSGDRLRFVDVFSSEQTTGLFGTSLGSMAMSKSERIAMLELQDVLMEMPGSLIQIPMEDPLPYLSSAYIPWWQCDQGNFLTCPLHGGLKDAFIEDPPDVVVVKHQTQLFNLKDFEPEMTSIGEAVEACITPSEKVGDQYSIYLGVRGNHCVEQTLSR